MYNELWNEIDIFDVRIKLGMKAFSNISFNSKRNNIARIHLNIARSNRKRENNLNLISTSLFVKVTGKHQ